MPSLIYTLTHQKGYRSGSRSYLTSQVPAQDSRPGITRRVVKIKLHIDTPNMLSFLPHEVGNNIYASYISPPT